jgi:hypothetical protein
MQNIDLATAPVAVSLSIIMIWLFLKLLKREDSREDMRNKKDLAFINAIAKVSTDMENTKHLLENVAKSIENTAKVNAEANQKIFDTFKKINCLKK